jgi:ribA/ribD-fused uncharacterized protein
MSDEIPERFKNCVTHDDKQIRGYFGPYRWLSNFHLCTVVHNGKEFPSSEHAYMYAKLQHPTQEDYDKIILMSCRDVKNWGQTVTLRPDWSVYKFRAMYEILCSKFTDNPELGDLLLATGDRYLEETNNWGDVVWGYDINKGGTNRLGKTHTTIRSALKLAQLFGDE